MSKNVSFTDYASGIRLQDCSKLDINRKNANNVIICWHDIMANFFWRSFVSLIKLRYWSKFHVNIITGSGVKTIFFCKELTRYPEIGNTPVWVFPWSGDCDKLWRLGKLGIPNSEQWFLMKCYWMLPNRSVTAFTVSELLKEN